MDSRFKEYVDSAGLKPQDMPAEDHPLLQNDADVETLGDLIDARRDHDYDAPALPGDRGVKPTDPVEDSYLTRADFEEEMLPVDPAPDAGADEDGILGDLVTNREPDMTGTVMGVSRGTSTHLPQDIGRDGFQIEEPIDIDGVTLPESIEEVTEMLLAEEDDAPAPEESETADQMLDATRRMA